MTNRTTKILPALAALAVLATDASADVLRCKIEGFSENVFITSSPTPIRMTVNMRGSASPPASETELLLSPTAWALTYSLN